jgi:CRISPR-associated protein Csh2
MNKRVYGVLGIVSKMSNWNADFTGYPKTTSDGSVFGSDKAFKYPIKVMWQDKGEKVLYIKSWTEYTNKNKETDIIPRSLDERYDYLFEKEENTAKKEKKDKKIDAEKKKEVMKNLFSSIDVKNFGATFASKGNNISITGAVQIGQGMNKYEDTTSVEQQILSPFRDASEKEGPKNADKDEAKQSTLGTKIVSDEAHYFYPFVINPLSYNEFVDLGVTEGYTEEDYMKFKEASLIAATSFNTNAKIGCENEFALFIETDMDTYLPDLSQYIAFDKASPLNVIDINICDLINELGERVQNVEIYYNSFTTKVNHNIKIAKEFNIFTKKGL